MRATREEIEGPACVDEESLFVYYNNYFEIKNENNLKT